MMYGNGWGWSAMMFMPLLWILLLGAVIWAAFRFAQPHPDRQSPQDRSIRETPQEILDRRFASGEIDAEAYTHARAQLAGRPSDTP
ncbi:MAG TPA: hypothetical protein VFJ97_14410 [Dermatophilaceae bacterium]|nr:hypothetical protein [Dermatophilaceae bacterium]